MTETLEQTGSPAAAPDMQALMTEIAQALVDTPEAVRVEAIKEAAPVCNNCLRFMEGLRED